ncbi:hypothetical protein AX15_003829 [Amanita polypyramis BW_CC]|nr:hypothetical protein AX15_003829 [Amanita polypyramis BW_CC]
MLESLGCCDNHEVCLMISELTTVRWRVQHSLCHPQLFPHPTRTSPLPAMTIDRLHAELLSHIFTLCCPGPRVLSHIGWINRPPQLDISHVCSWWRQVALGTGTLWNDIIVDSTSDKCVGIAQEWLLRAGKSPVTFNSHVWGSPFVPFLAPFRLRSLSLILSPVELSALQQLPDDALSSLEHLSLHIPCGDIQLHLTDAQCPALKSVSLSLVTLSPGSKDISLPWGQLEYLFLDKVPIEICWDALRQCQSLTECTLAANYNSDTPPTYTGAPFPVPNLQKLYVPYSSFLEPLILPRLHTLAITYVVPSWTGNYFQSTINPSVLQTLDMRTVLNGEGGFNGVKLLEWIPSLRSIVLPGTTLSTADMARLSAGELGPNLQMIALSRRHNTEDVLTMVEKRLDHASSDSHRRPVPPFTVVAFSPCKYGRCKERIALLEERGTQVHILHGVSYDDLSWVSGGLFKMKSWDPVRI